MKYTAVDVTYEPVKLTNTFKTLCRLIAISLKL